MGTVALSCTFCNDLCEVIQNDIDTVMQIPESGSPVQLWEMVESLT